ncbi:hypothetical protein JCM18899A_54910 [Nocardioides sp. AN3]
MSADSHIYDVVVIGGGFAGTLRGSGPDPRRGHVMRIGIGLPNHVPGVDRASIITWARGAEEAGFASVAALDRLTCIGYDPLVALTAAAAVTERVEQVTNVLLAPLHVNAALLAK